MGRSSFTTPWFITQLPCHSCWQDYLHDIEVMDAPLDYNIILGCIYTYAMLALTSAVHCKMLFPHNGKIITID